MSIYLYSVLFIYFFLLFELLGELANLLGLELFHFSVLLELIIFSDIERSLVLIGKHFLVIFSIVIAILFASVDILSFSSYWKDLLFQVLEALFRYSFVVIDETILIDASIFFLRLIKLYSIKKLVFHLLDASFFCVDLLHHFRIVRYNAFIV